MKILFFGDSITDAGRNKNEDGTSSSLGYGYVRAVGGQLMGEDPVKYELFNRGISGHRVVDLYARIKCDCWNLQPDVLSILIGVNDVWHGVHHENGVEIDRFEKVYRMLLEDTLKVLPNVKLMILEPFVLPGSATLYLDKYQEFLAVKEYAKVCKKLAQEFNAVFIPLQEQFDKTQEKYGENTYFLRDGVHPNTAGAQLIANAWLDAFKSKIDN